MLTNHNWTRSHLDGEDENLGWGIKIKKPKIKIKIKKPKVTIKKVVPKVTIDTKKPLKTISKGAGDLLKNSNPLTQGRVIANLTPFTKKIYNDVDKISGNTLSTVERVSNLPSKALRGEKITKADIVEAIVTAMKVAAVVASGGSAAAIIAVASSQLKQGPLGESTLGRNLLTLGEVGGAAYAAYSAGAAAAASKGAQEVGQKTAADAVQKAVQDKAVGIVKSKAEEEFEKKTKIPVGYATMVYNGATGKTKIATLPKDIVKKVAETQLKKAGLGDSVTQAILSNNATALGVMIKDAPNLAMTKVQREVAAQKVKIMKLADVESLKKKALADAEKFKKDATDTDKLRQKFDAMADSEAKKQVKKQLDDAIANLVGSQKRSVKSAEEAQLEAGRSAIMISAAEEGRYTPSVFGNMKTPMIIAGTGLLAVGLWYFKDDIQEVITA